MPLATNQASLEAEMQSRGEARARKRQRESLAKGREVSTPAGARLLRELPAILVAKLEEWKKEAKARPGQRHRALEKLDTFRPELVASLALRVVLDALSQSRPYTATALKIAGLLEDEERFNNFKAQDKISFQRAQKRSADYSSYSERRRHILKSMAYFGMVAPVWPPEIKAAVGIVLLELIAAHCGILEVYGVRNRRKVELRIAPTADALAWAEDINNRGALMAPMSLPFVEEPLDWISPLSGGFHTLDLYQTAVVKTADREYLETELTPAIMPEVYGAMNALQRTRWTINPAVFEMFSHLWEHGLNVNGLPRREKGELPAKPADIATNKEARLAWRKAARAVHDANHRRQTDRMAAAKLHWVCQEYLGRGFYFCYQLDWRGRAYPRSYYLHPQGNDLTKSLLQFVEGKPITSPEAIRWHKIHGANCWGLDKVSFQERVDWVDASASWLLKIAEDPLDNMAWQEAEEPWQFLAWLLDWYQLQNDPAHVSHLPIHQDATQSGIQIYSLLLRDREGAEATNCVPCDAPQDLYARVAERLIERLQEDGSDLAKRWLDFGIDRACAKRPVMTRVYNATQHSARTYIQEWAGARANKLHRPIPSVTTGASGIWFLTTHLWAAMAETISSTQRAQDWLSEVADIFSARGIPIRWTTPLGFPVKQWYPKWAAIAVKTSIGEKYRQTTLRSPRGDVDARRMRAGFAPNVIHSLDASAMMRTVTLAGQRGLTSFACIHDSYATLAADSQALCEATREAYISLFTQDVLGNLRDQLQAQVVGTELPPLPPYGSLDVSELRRSSYFFS